MTIAKDGAESLIIPEENNFDLELMDLLMPIKIDDIEATRRIRNSDSPNINMHMPIIAKLIRA